MNDEEIKKKVGDIIMERIDTIAPASTEVTLDGKEYLIIPQTHIQEISGLVTDAINKTIELKNDTN